MKRNMRNGFTLVELIATIVIIGIAFLSIPMAMEVTNKAIEFTQTSRGFYHGLAKMKIITNLPWDENNVADFQDKGYYQALQTEADSTNELKCDPVTLSRSGHYVGLETALYRRRCSSQNATDDSALGREGDYDDVDDYEAETTTYSIENVFTITSNVDYIAYNNASPATATFNFDDAASTQSTSIKRIGVFITEGTGAAAQNIGSYFYYAANIGTYQPVKKANP